MRSAAIAAFLILQASSDESRVVELATALLQNDQSARAVQLLQGYLKTHPASYKASIFLAFAQVREEQYETARALSQRLSQRDPGDYYAQHVLGLSLVGLNRFAEAEACFKRAIALKADFSESHFQLALLYARKPETLARAYELLETAKSLGQSSAVVQKNLGSVAMKLGRVTDAIAHLRLSIDADSTSADAWFQLADAYRKAGRAGEAREAGERFAALNRASQERKDRETRAETLYQEGMKILTASDDYSRAYEIFRQSAQLAPLTGAAHYRMAQIDYLRDQNSRALAAIDQAIAVNAYEAEYHFVRARCLETSDPAGAGRSIETAIGLDDSVADFHNLRGNLKMKAGELGEAISSYRRAVALEPQNDAFRANLNAAQARAGGRRI